MDADLWRRARDIFDEAAGAPPTSRTSLIARLANGDETLIREVESLLAAHEEERGPLDAPPGALLPNVLLAPARDGDRIGPWRIVRLIGEGGAGVVYEAARDDANYQRVVALKLLRPDRESRDMVRRFRLERQVLAGLDHPNIGRMLDAGTSESGRPYLVMEYVEGVPVDRWCETRALSIRDRIKIFLQICDAVACAHRNLVVHCDIKPANILVTPEGVPKLLDFGIAKLLRPELALDGAATRAFGRMLTPDYASPEQVRGEAVNTAGDVYSLGVLLYRLLTGKLPYEIGAQSLLEIERIVTTQEAPPASSLRPELKGDIDAIIAMAMRKEPHRRYPGADALAADLERHLTGMPVMAHAGTFTYRARKFVTRHRGSVIAASLVLASLATAAGVSIYYGRIAERRFHQARELTRFVLFRFDDAIRSGQTNARRVLVNEGLEYLKRLSADAGSDTGLARELVEGYLKIGDIQGNPFAASLGDSRGARASYQAALDGATRLADTTLQARAEARLADLSAMTGDRTQAIAMYQGALARNVPERLRTEILTKLGFTQSLLGDLKNALASYEQAVISGKAITESQPGDAEGRRLFASALERSGETMAKLGQTAQGITRLSAAREIHMQLVSASPENAETARRAFACSVNLADALAQAGRKGEAASLLGQLVDEARSRSERDPGNQLFRRDRYLVLGRLVDLLAPDATHRQQARALTAELMELLRPIVEMPGAGYFELQQYAWLLVTTPFTDLRNPAAALPAAARAAELTQRAQPAILDTLARAQAATGDYAAAAATEREAIALLPASGESDLRKELTANLTSFAAKADKAGRK